MPRNEVPAMSNDDKPYNPDEERDSDAFAIDLDDDKKVRVTLLPAGLSNVLNLIILGLILGALGFLYYVSN